MTLHQPQQKPHRVVVLGAGYAGLPAAKRLAREVFADEVEVTLVSAGPEFVERPRLHQIATGQRVMRHPLAGLLAGTPVRLRIGTVAGLDLDRRRVRFDDGATLAFDTLVYALGSNIDVASVPGVAGNALSLSGLRAAGAMGSVLRQIAGEGGRVVVCGGGLTGIETAGELAESFPSLEVELLSRGAPGAWLSEKARAYLGRAFDDLEVRVRPGVSVFEVGSSALTTDAGPVAFDACVWAGGFAVPDLARTSGLSVNAGGRALVDPTLRSVSHPDVYVIGDAAAASGAWGDELAMGCRTGGFSGPQVADILAARLSGREPKAFRYRYFHECISIGRRRGLVQFLAADETPKDRILVGWRAIRYKNATLRSAQWMFRHPGPYLGRRRRHIGHSAPAPGLSVAA
ncbi:MAG TPA: FAD-dependent oxidoreductase [Frankiaceae bacterium]|jgi:NADH dehydrogenase FAD-containing subunit|nr:FAD-dependent oxidoreductase [Frankiaceae bacterium]